MDVRAKQDGQIPSLNGNPGNFTTNICKTLIFGRRANLVLQIVMGCTTAGVRFLPGVGVYFSTIPASEHTLFL